MSLSIFGTIEDLIPLMDGSALWHRIVKTFFQCESYSTVSLTLVRETTALCKKYLLMSFLYMCFDLSACP